MRCQPNWKSMVYIWLNNKQPCLLCDELSDHGSAICPPCKKELPWLGSCCPACALPQPIEQSLCAQCLKQQPAFSSVLAPWTYSFPIDSLISRFKYRANWPFGRLLTELYAQWLQDRFDQGVARPDYLLPVPLTARRLRQRGFNQAAMLANGLSKHLALPCNEHLLKRIKEGPSQQQLTAKARKRNLLDAFTLSLSPPIEGLHLALVDDVLTTGATAEVLARLLLKAGARRVDVYCLARTPRPGDMA